ANLEADNKYKIKSIVEKEKGKIKKEVEDKSLLKILEKQHVINQLKKQITIAQRQAEQGSMQIQGEVQELELEKLLKNEYPYDEVMPVAKGINGADILFSVRNDSHVVCGKIAIESKRSKAFSKSWVDKLKDDQRRHKAEVAILVTQTLPKNICNFG